jgi:uncharacterized cupin superfamily protein
MIPRTGVTAHGRASAAACPPSAETSSQAASPSAPRRPILVTALIVGSSALRQNRSFDVAINSTEWKRPQRRNSARRPRTDWSHETPSKSRLLSFLAWAQIDQGITMKEITIERSPSKTKLETLGVSSWPIWEKEASTFDWFYEESETCCLLEGQVRVEPSEGNAVEFGAGDLVTFPEGMACVWRISRAVRKHYRFG